MQDIVAIAKSKRVVSMYLANLVSRASARLAKTLNGYDMYLIVDLRTMKHILLSMSINRKRSLNSRGFVHIELVLIVGVVVAVIGFALWRIQNLNNKTDVKSVNDGSSQQNQSTKEKTATGDVQWSWGGSNWQSSSKPPACKEPIKFSQTAVKSSLVSGILYPGQVRGGNFKPHGGFKLNISNNQAEVKAIYDGAVVDGTRYIEGGEVQYMFTIENDCGIAYRFDHLLELSPVFVDIAKSLPEPKVNDSRTTKITKPVQVKSGDLIATAIGFKNTRNYTFDLGVYDYRKLNDAAKNGSLTNNDLPDMRQAGYALCWLKMFDGVDYSSYSAVDSSAQKSSTYCK